MRSLSNYLFLLAFLLVANTSLAQPLEGSDPLAGIPEEGETNLELDLVDLHFVPMGRRCEVDGVTYQCFTLPEYKEILEVDINYHNLIQQHNKLKLTLTRTDEINKKLQESITQTEIQVTVLRDERKRLYDRWVEENRLRYDAEHRSFVSNRIAWALAALEAVAIAGLVVGGL